MEELPPEIQLMIWQKAFDKEVQCYLWQEYVIPYANNFRGQLIFDSHRRFGMWCEAVSCGIENACLSSNLSLFCCASIKSSEKDMNDVETLQLQLEIARLKEEVRTLQEVNRANTKSLQESTRLLIKLKPPRTSAHHGCRGAAVQMRRRPRAMPAMEIAQWLVRCQRVRDSPCASLGEDVHTHGPCRIMSLLSRVSASHRKDCFPRVASVGARALPIVHDRSRSNRLLLVDRNGAGTRRGVVNVL